MDEKEIIKWGLIALGLYLVYEYIESNGGLSAVLTGTGAAVTTCPAGFLLVSGQCVATPVTTQTTPVTTPVKTVAPPATTPCVAPNFLQNGVCTPPAAAAAVSQIILAQATNAGEPDSLNMDQWCYYYAQATGQTCPDPGSFSAAVYSANGATDRTTPISVSQWLAIMQTQNAGLTGLGAFSKPNPKWRPEWLN
jgi:hypothetical protein